MEKQEILNEMSLMDVNLLQRLYDYSRFIVIPEEDLLVNVNMTQMVDKAHQLADSFFPEWTDRSKSDFGQFLVELMALFSEKDFWYINAFAHESLLRNTSVYSDAFVKAVSRGYRPKLCKGSVADFEVEFAEGAEKKYAPGDLVVIQNSTGLSFTNQTEFTVPDRPSGSLTLPLTLREGQFSYENVTFNGHNIPLIRKNIDVDSIILIISNVVWTRVETFGLSSAGDKHYIVIPESDGRATIFFGDDGYGARPNVGDPCAIKYRVSSLEAGNAVKGIVRVGKSNSERPATDAIQISASVDGSSPETLAQIKNNAILFSGTKGACYNTFTTQKFLEGLNRVKKASVNIQGNTVYFYIIPTDGSIASPEFLDGIVDEMYPYLMNGYVASALPTTYINVAPLTVTASFLTGTNTANAVSMLRQLIIDYTDPLVNAQYATDFDLSDLSLVLRSRVPGLQNVVFNVVAGGVATNIPIGSGQITKKLAPSEITVNVINI